MPLDPDDGADSSALDAILGGPAAALTAVVLLAGEQARVSGWAARTAVTLARRWPGPRHTVLIDLDVAQPTLHQITGVTNEEGVIDVLELGASLHRIAVPVAGGRFDVLPAGAFGGDSDAAVLQSDAWPRILYDAAARRETLLLYVPEEAPGAAALVERVGAVLVLAEGAEAKQIVERLPRRYGVLAALEPALAAAEVATAAAPAPGSAAEAAVSGARVRAVGRDGREALIAELRRRQRAARLVRREAPGGTPPAPAPPEAVSTVPPVLVPAGVGDAARDVRLEAGADDVAPAAATAGVVPPVAATAGAPATAAAAPAPAHGTGASGTGAAAPRARRRFAHPIGWTIGVVLVVSLVAGSLHFLAERFGGTEEAAVPAPAPAPVTPPTPAPPVARDAVAYSVALAAHQNLARAFELVDALTASQPDVSFYISPLERNGALHYHVMAGPVADSAAALALRDTLLVRRVKTTSTPTDIRYTPLALLIGDYTARGEAEQQIAELRRLDIPAYLLVGLAADSAPLYRVFVGGFAGPVEAEVTRQLLRAAGVRDRLINRTRSSTR